MTSRSAAAAAALLACVGLVTSACSSGQPSGVQNSPSATPSATSRVSSPSVPGTVSAAPSPALPASPASPVAPAAPATPAAPASGEQQVPAGFEPASVTFVSAKTGFVLGDASCAGGACATLVTTVDGGHAWSLVATVPPALGEAGVSKVRFANTHDGWAFGPQLWSTHDGGHSWRQIAETAPVADVEASNGRAYAIVGDQVLRSDVTGDSWVAVPGAPPVSATGAIALHGAAVWIVSGGAPDASALLTSPDGVSWQTFARPCASLGADWALAGVAPVSETSIYLLCGGDAGAGSESKKVLLSTDAGAHTTPTSADPPRGGDANGIAAASMSVVAVSARSGASEVYRSDDGGDSWQAPLQEGDGGVGYFDLGFTTPTQGVVVYGQPGMGSGVTAKLLITRDAGASWAPVSF